MPTPTKFTEPVRQTVIEALKIGASLRTAAAVAGIDHKTLTRWLDKGRTAEEGSRWQVFFEACEAAIANPKMRALGLIYEKLADDANVAWKFIERREDGYAPPMPQAPPPQQGPVVIQLSLADGRPIALTDTVIEVQAVEQDEDTQRGQLPEPTPISSA